MALPQKSLLSILNPVNLHGTVMTDNFVKMIYFIKQMKKKSMVKNYNGIPGRHRSPEKRELSIVYHNTNSYNL
ncbi:hypothetical protein QQG55_7745 [Brugia pahangi]